MTTNRIQQPTYEQAPGKSGKVRQRNFPFFTVALVILVTGGLWHYGSDYHEQAEYHFVNHLSCFAMAEHVCPCLKAVVGPRDHGRKSK